MKLIKSASLSRPDAPEQMTGFYQDVVLHFSDGQSRTAVVEAFCGFDETPIPRVIDVEVGAPERVPQSLLDAFSPLLKGDDHA